MLLGILLSWKVKKKVTLVNLCNVNELGWGTIEWTDILLPLSHKSSRLPLLNKTQCLSVADCEKRSAMIEKQLLPIFSYFSALAKKKKKGQKNIIIVHTLMVASSPNMGKDNFKLKRETSNTKYFCGNFFFQMGGFFFFKSTNRSKQPQWLIL